MKNFLIILFLIFPISSWASDSWTLREKTLEGTYITLHLVDWGQTLYIADNPEELFEHNRILGRHPSRGEVNTYFVATGIGHVMIVNALSHRWREPVQWATILLRTYSVNRNHRIGIGFAF